jgi:hypothetical protein
MLGPSRSSLHIARGAQAALLAFAALVAAFSDAHSAAQPAERVAQSAAPSERRELLNSERIAARFGSYGIAVLESDGRVRVSNLYSEESGGRVGRTFAVVKYPDSVDSSIAAEHDEIARGGSIGAVFAAHGFKVGKTNLRYVELEATPRVADLMHVPVGTRLAAHAYVLDVTKGGRSIEYALLVEIHHPDYLKVADLESIYGPASASGREQSLEALLATAREKMSR